MSATKLNRSQRGFTLIECVVALALLMIGGLAAAHISVFVMASNRNIGANTQAVAVANMLIAQISDARFIPDNEDPGLAIGAHSTAVAGSAIDLVGDYPLVGPIFRVSYEVRPCTRCADPYGAGLVGLGGIEIVVTVANMPAFDHEGQRRLSAPLRFYLRRDYSPSTLDPALVRGW